MSYNPRQFPHYGEVRFQHHLRSGETVWADGRRKVEIV